MMQTIHRSYTPRFSESFPFKLGISVLLVGLSLSFLRQQIAEDLHLGISQELSAGILLGWMDDVLLPILSFSIALCLSKIFQIRFRKLWIFFAVFIWICSVSNAIYARFFQSALSWWVLRYQWKDLFSVGGSASVLAISAHIFLSTLLVALAIFMASRSKSYPFLSLNWKRRCLGFLIGALMGVMTVLARQSPVWLGKVHVDDLNRNSVLTEHILVTWWRQISQPDDGGSSSRSGKGSGNSILSSEEQLNPSLLVSQFSHFSEDTPPLLANPSLPESGRSLRYPLQHSLDEQKKARQELGLNPQKAPNVIVLFLESVRAFELQHPQIGPQIFPNLKSVLAKHSIHFQNAYSSSGSAGQTVRGQFSTLCSHLTDQIGPAEYIAYPSLQVTCLAELFKKQDYQTLWFNSHRKTFHNKSLFESIHGTDYFFDRDYFFDQGIRERVGDWGYADLPVLQQVLTHLESLHHSQQKFFANVLTISTHHPFYSVPEGVIPEGLGNLVKNNPEHAGYLSRLRYADQALAAFFDRFFKSPLANDTIIVLLGDHSVNVYPNLPLKSYQQAEMRFRIPLALISKNIQNPKVIRYPVHQIDVAPTLSRIAGLSGEVSWMGRDLLSGEGSPWIARPDLFFYRTRNKLCVSQGNQSQAMDCYQVSHLQKDPMYDYGLPKVVESLETSLFFKKFIHANHLTLIRNLN